MVKTLLFDAANTLIYKPDLFDRISAALEKNGHATDKKTLQSRHKLVSEIINFPDRTDKQFYELFNTEVLLSLGIIPEKKILDDIFDACTYLEWKPFEDCKYLEDLALPKCVLSNFNSGLEKLLTGLMPVRFEHFVVSETAKCRKPDAGFYKMAIDQLNVEPSEIVYFGDSLKLDIIPALKCGMNAVLIDRSDEFTNFKDRITSFEQIPAIVENLNKKN